MTSKSRPLPVLAGAAEATGEVVVYDPFTGTALVLHDAATAELAAWKQALSEWRQMADTAEGYVDGELVARMDREARWTFHDGGFKIVASSPRPTVSYHDPEKLRARLLRLASEGLISVEAVEAAVPIIPERIGVNVGPLAQLEKLGGRVARAVRTYRATKPPGPRRVRVTR